MKFKNAKLNVKMDTQIKELKYILDIAYNSPDDNYELMSKSIDLLQLKLDSFDKNSLEAVIKTFIESTNENIDDPCCSVVTTFVKFLAKMT